MKIRCVKTRVGHALSNGRFIVVSAVLLFGGMVRNAPALTNVIPPNVQRIVENAVNYAITNEDANTVLFNQHYQYTRNRNWLYHNEAGKLTKSKQTKTEENMPPTNPGAGKRENLVKGRDLKLKSFPIKDIIARFDFTLIGEEPVVGRPAYVIEFAPHQNIPVRKLMDPFINRATGTIWVDQEDYAVSKAKFHLNSPLKAAYGVAGQINDFSGTISRSRTPEGYWHIRAMTWHLDERLLAVRRIVDYSEERIHPLPISAAP